MENMDDFCVSHNYTHKDHWMEFGPIRYEIE